MSQKLFNLPKDSIKKKDKNVNKKHKPKIGSAKKVPDINYLTQQKRTITKHISESYKNTGADYRENKLQEDEKCHNNQSFKFHCSNDSQSKYPSRLKNKTNKVNEILKNKSSVIKQIPLTKRNLIEFSITESHCPMIVRIHKGYPSSTENEQEQGSEHQSKQLYASASCISCSIEKISETTGDYMLMAHTQNKKKKQPSNSKLKTDQGDIVCELLNPSPNVSSKKNKTKGSRYLIINDEPFQNIYRQYSTNLALQDTPSSENKRKCYYLKEVQECNINKTRHNGKRQTSKLSRKEFMEKESRTNSFQLNNTNSTLISLQTFPTDSYFKGEPLLEIRRETSLNKVHSNQKNDYFKSNFNAKEKIVFPNDLEGFSGEHKKDNCHQFSSESVKAMRNIEKWNEINYVKSDQRRKKSPKKIQFNAKCPISNKYKSQKKPSISLSDSKLHTSKAKNKKSDRKQLKHNFKHDSHNLSDNCVVLNATQSQFSKIFDFIKSKKIKSPNKNIHELCNNNCFLIADHFHQGGQESFAEDSEETDNNNLTTKQIIKAEYDKKYLGVDKYAKTNHFTKNKPQVKWPSQVSKSFSTLQSNTNYDKYNTLDFTQQNFTCTSAEKNNELYQNSIQKCMRCSKVTSKCNELGPFCSDCNLNHKLSKISEENINNALQDTESSLKLSKELTYFDFLNGKVNSNYHCNETIHSDKEGALKTGNEGKSSILNNTLREKQNSHPQNNSEKSCGVNLKENTCNISKPCSHESVSYEKSTTLINKITPSGIEEIADTEYPEISNFEEYTKCKVGVTNEFHPLPTKTQVSSATQTDNKLRYISQSHKNVNINLNHSEKLYNHSNCSSETIKGDYLSFNKQSQPYEVNNFEYNCNSRFSLPLADKPKYVINYNLTENGNCSSEISRKLGHSDVGWNCPNHNLFKMFKENENSISKTTKTKDELMFKELLNKNEKKPTHEGKTQVSSFFNPMFPGKKYQRVNVGENKSPAYENIKKLNSVINITQSNDYHSQKNSSIRQKHNQHSQFYGSDFYQIKFKKSDFIKKVESPKFDKIMLDGEFKLKSESQNDLLNKHLNLNSLSKTQIKNIPETIAKNINNNESNFVKEDFNSLLPYESKTKFKSLHSLNGGLNNEQSERFNGNKKEFIINGQNEELLPFASMAQKESDLNFNKPHPQKKFIRNTSETSDFLKICNTLIINGAALNPDSVNSISYFKMSCSKTNTRAHFQPSMPFSHLTFNKKERVLPKLNNLSNNLEKIQHNFVSGSYVENSITNVHSLSYIFLNIFIKDHGELTSDRKDNCDEHIFYQNSLVLVPMTRTKSNKELNDIILGSRFTAKIKATMMLEEPTNDSEYNVFEVNPQIKIVKNDQLSKTKITDEANSDLSDKENQFKRPSVFQVINPLKKTKIFTNSKIKTYRIDSNIVKGKFNSCCFRSKKLKLNEEKLKNENQNLNYSDVSQTDTLSIKKDKMKNSRICVNNTSLFSNIRQAPFLNFVSQFPTKVCSELKMLKQTNPKKNYFPCAILTGKNM